MNRLLKALASLVFPAMLLSCDGGIRADESLSVNPDILEVEAELASYTLSVAADCGWTAEIIAENGADASWLSLSKSKGQGSAQLGLRVFANPYNAQRKAEIRFSSAGGSTASVAVIQKAAEGGEDMSSINMRVGSYNIRMSTLSESDPANAWAERSKRLLTSIKENDFDIFGLQEVSTASQDWLKSNFGDTYDFWFFSPYSQGGSGDRAQGIAFRKSRFSGSDKHFFWASNTPESCTENDTGSQGNFKRGGICGTFTEKATGISFFFMNTHACLNREPNDAYAGVYVDMEKKYNAENLTSFFVGDMNSRPEYAAIATYREWWKDSYETAARRSGASNSYNAYSNAAGKYRIDYIFVRGKVQVDEFCINNTLYDNRYPSDHFPLWADVCITK